MKTIAVIPAKGQSSRLPNKNMYPLNGQPMLQYTIDYALECSDIDNVYISTEDENIEKYCSLKGLNVIKRPEALCGDTPIFDVYVHAYNYINDTGMKILYGLQPDHPDRRRNPTEILNIFKDCELDILFSSDAAGAKNGAHYILKREILEGKTPERVQTIIDDCTNIHYMDDAKTAAKNL